MAKILIIEDEEILLNILKNKLQKEGYDVIVAQDGGDGIQKIKSENPDLVLLDILMPKMSGMEVLEILKKDGILPSLPVIVISNSGQPVELEKVKAYGVKDALVKAEFNPQEVIDKIERFLPKDDVAQKNEESHKTISDIDPSAFLVLVVEDDKFLRDLMIQKISKEGFNVLDAVDGEDGLKIAFEKKPHIILLDLMLPGIDGFEVLKRLRESDKIDKIPILILSNLGQQDDLDKAMQLGATDYLIKAHNTPGEIVQKVKALLAENYIV